MAYLWIRFDQLSGEALTGIITDAQGNALTTVFVVHPETLSPLPDIPFQFVVGVVPQTKVLSTEITLPPITEQQAMAAVPYLLEEQLMTPIEQLHFVIKPHADKTSAIVFAVQKNLIQAWIDSLKKLNLSPNYFVTDANLLPAPTPANMTGWVENNTILIHLEKNQPAATTVENISLLLTLCSQEKQNSFSGKKLFLFKTADAIIKEDELPLSSEIIESAQLFLEAYAKPAQLDNCINLLQTEYPTQSSFSIYRMAPQLAVFFVLLTFFVWIASDVTRYFYLQRDEKTFNQKINEAYHDLFSRRATQADYRVLLEETLLDSRQYQMNHLFLDWLFEITPLLKKMPQLKIKQISFRSSVFTLTLETEDIRQVDRLVTLLTKQHFRVQISTTVSDRLTKADLQLRR